MDAIQNVSVKSLAVGHKCCDICADSCHCLCPCKDSCKCDVTCVGPQISQPQAEQQIRATDKSAVQPAKMFDVTEDDRENFKSKLHHYKDTLYTAGLFTQPGIVTGFSDQLICSLTGELEYIESVDSLMTNFPFFNVGHAIAVFDIVLALGLTLVEVVDQLIEASSESDATDDDSDDVGIYSKPCIVYEDSD